MKIHNLIIIWLGLFILTGCEPSSDSGSANVGVKTELRIEKQSGGFVTFNVEVASTEKERSVGLMNRDFMPVDEGMLFVFQKETFRSFWMKNTLIPLDIIFVNKDGIVAHIHENAVPNDLTGISSQMPVMYAVEVNGGQSLKHGIQVGDTVFHDKLKRTLAE